MANKQPTPKEASDWFKGLMKRATKDLTSKFMLGNLYAFRYDPKYKLTLPVYDTLPLVMPLDYYDNGFLGINIHYLPVKTRLVFLRNIMITNYKRLIEGKSAKISYRDIKAGGIYKFGMVCIRRYLYSHMKSKALKININDWPKASILQSHNFVKMTETEVWKASLMALKGNSNKNKSNGKKK